MLAQVSWEAMGENQDTKLVPLANVENIYGIIAMSFKKKPCSTYHVILVWQLMFEMHAKEQSCWSWKYTYVYSKVINHVYNHPMWFSVFGPCQLYHFGVVFGETFFFQVLEAQRNSNLFWRLYLLGEVAICVGRLKTRSTVLEIIYLQGHLDAVVFLVFDFQNKTPGLYSWQTNPPVVAKNHPSMQTHHGFNQEDISKCLHVDEQWGM